MEEKQKRHNFAIRIVGVVIYTTFKVTSYPILCYQVFLDLMRVRETTGDIIHDPDLNELMPYRKLIINETLNLVIAIDILCYACNGFEFLHSFGGLSLFYLLAAVFNSSEDSKAQLTDCYDEVIQQD